MKILQKLEINEVRTDLKQRLLDRFTGQIPSVYLALANSPDLALQLMDHFDGFRLRDGLPPRLNEFVLLRVTAIRNADYEWHYHEVISERMGITKEERNKLRLPLNQADWATNELAVLEAVDELLAEGATLSEKSTDQLRAIGLVGSAIIELIFLVGAYATLCSFINSIDLQRDQLAGDPKNE